MRTPIARLNAAAPDLLAVLQKVMTPELADAADAVINERYGAPWPSKRPAPPSPRPQERINDLRNLLRMLRS